MKTYNSIIVIVILALMWGCNSKREKTAEEIAAQEDSTRNAAAAQVAERKAKLREEREMKAEQRRAAIEEKANTARTFKDASGNVVYYKAEVEPQYTGGNDAMMQYLRDNLKYPESALSRRDEGTVFVDFIVDKKGKVRDVTATETTWAEVDSTLIAEAVRVVAAMPTWVAGTQGGKPVDVAFSIPIIFELDN